jgi:hypothetical protein
LVPSSGSLDSAALKFTSSGEVPAVGVASITGCGGSFEAK